MAVSACKEKIQTVTSIPTPAERLVCEPKPERRPAVPPEYRIDWPRVATVAQAKAEHEKFVAVVRTREGIIAGYVLNIEDRLFTCWTNVEWRRQFEANLPRPEG